MFSKRRAYIVEAIPGDVWELLDQDEKALLFLIEDRLMERFSNEELVIRLKELRYMRTIRMKIAESDLAAQIAREVQL